MISQDGQRNKEPLELHNEEEVRAGPARQLRDAQEEAVASKATIRFYG